MIVYHSSGVIRKLVRYTEKYYPKVLLIVRPEDTVENRNRGYKPGQPDILILEQRCRYIELAIWVTSEMSKTEAWFLRRLSRQSYETIVSDDFNVIFLDFCMYMAKCGDHRMDNHQLETIRKINHDQVIRKYTPRTMSDPDSDYDGPPRIISDNGELRIVVKYVRDYYPSAVIIPGLGVDGQPDLIIISPSVLHNGLAIWVSHTYRSYYFPKLSDNQFGFLKRMALRSYVTVASTYRPKIIRFINEYMGGVYENGHNLPRHTYPHTYLVLR